MLDSQLAASQTDPSPTVIAFMIPGGIRNSLFYNPANAGIPSSVGIPGTTARSPTS